jgi:hypothetical protein
LWGKVEEFMFTISVDHNGIFFGFFQTPLFFLQYCLWLGVDSILLILYTVVGYIVPKNHDYCFVLSLYASLSMHYLMFLLAIIGSAM